MTAEQKQTAGSFLKYYLPLVIWIAFISFASTGEFSADNTSLIIGPLLHWLVPRISPERLATIHFMIRKIAHFTEYAILAFLAARAFRNSFNIVASRWLLLSILLVVIYALLDEYHQSFVPSRTASLGDSFIDMTGGLTMLLLLWRRYRRNALPNEL
jgi:VanZ family protein